MTRPVAVVGIGASAGGLEALRDMLGAARVPTGMCFVIVQHLDPTHESMLAPLLGRHTGLEVVQCAGGERVEADKVFIIPPGRGLAIQEGVLELTDFSQPRGMRRPIDDFFISLAEDQQANAACVILSGTGADGTIGLRAVKENGGLCIVQTPDTAKYDGMPLSAVGTGLVDFVRNSTEIPDCLHRYFARRGDNVPVEARIVADHVDELCAVLRSAVGHDFSGYKRSTLIRRIDRRMHVLGMTAASAYLQRIKADHAECEALLRDLLINVTRFFRDPEAFELLRRKALEPLFDGRDATDEIRVWVPGCSSGEEAYSIAMLLAKIAEERAAPFNVQVFATDIDEQMLQIARDGSYPLSALVDIPYELRERYTIPYADRFTIAPEIRDAVRFSPHSLVKDPPFSRIDLVSCRNLLIYFDDKLQQSVFPLFHYALRPGGCLFLGPSESIGRFEHLFPALDQQARLFRRSPGAPSYPIDLPGSYRSAEARGDRRDDRPLRAQAEDVAARRLIERYAPASMVLDHDAGILAAYGRLASYFDFPVTRAGGSSAITLARPGLRGVLGPLLRQVRDKSRRAIARDVGILTDAGSQPVNVICDPLPDGTVLLVITDSGRFQPDSSDDLFEIEQADDNLDALEEELRLTRHRLRSAVEELETANEELKSSNEEMMSMNEELQSTNEELATVNDELKTKVDQLTNANSDLRNFFASTDLAVVVLDRDLRVRSFTDAARAIFPLQPSDHGRPLADVSTRLGDYMYLEDARTVVDGGTAKLRRVARPSDKQSYSLRTLPYRLQNGAVDGAVLVFTNISEALQMEDALAAERDWRGLAVRAAGIGVWEYYPETGIAVLDDAEQTLIGARREEPLETILDRVIFEADRDRIRALLAATASGGDDFDTSFRVRGTNGTTRWIKGLGRAVPDSEPARIVGVSVDVTPEYAVAETRELMVREMNHRVKNLFAIIGSMIMGASKSQSDVPKFAREMRDRISALGRAHSLAAASNIHEAIDLRRIVETTIAPYMDHAAIRMEGPTIRVVQSCLSPLSMMLHEWATNAAKYGAFHKPTGRLDLSWRQETHGVTLDWAEEFEPSTGEGGASGFGSRLIEMSARQLGATIDRTITHRSARMVLTLPNDVFTND